MTTLDQQLDHKIALIISADESLLSHKSNELQQRLLAQHGQDGVSTSCFSYAELKRNTSALYEKLLTPNLFSKTQLIIIKGVDKSIDIKLIKHMSQATHTFMILEMSEALPASQVKELRVIDPKMLVIHCQGSEVRELIVRKLQGTTLSTPEIIDYLVAHFKPDSASIELEIDKLLLFAGDLEPPVSIAAIEGVLTQNLATSYDAMLAGLRNSDWHAFDAAYKGMLGQGVTHPTLIRAIANHFVRQLKTNSLPHYKPYELINIIEQLTELEIKSKSSLPAVLINYELLRIFKLDLL